MRNKYLTALLVAGTILSACVPADEPEDVEGMDMTPDAAAVEPVELADMGAAPELVNEVWLNTPEALRLSDLRGNVVLLDFWTFG